MPAPKNNRHNNKDGEELASSFLQCRIKPSLKAKIVRKANGQKVCQYIINLIEKDLENNE